MKRKERNVAVAILSFVCVLTVTLFQGVLLPDDFVKAATTKGEVTASSLNVRTGPGTNYEQVRQDGNPVYLYKGDIVSILGEENNFYKVRFSYNDKTVNGYSSKYYIRLTNATAAPTATPTATPKPTSKPKATAKPTTTPDTVSLDGNTVPGAAASSTKTATGLKVPAKVTASSLRVRTKASTKSAQLTYNGTKVSLKKGTKGTILKEKIVNGVVWYYYRFKFDGEVLKGYVLSDYVKLTLDENVKGTITSSSKVIVRNSAGVSDDYLTYEDENVKLKNKQSVTVIKETNANSKKWFKVSFTYKSEKLKGYILANQVLFKPASTTATPTPTPTPVPTPTVKPTVKPTATPSVKPTKNPDSASSGAISTENPDVSSGSSVTTKIGKVTTGPLNVRLKPGLDQEKLVYNGENVKLSLGQEITIVNETKVGTDQWYYVKFTYSDTSLSGYVMGQYVEVQEVADATGSDGATTEEFEAYLEKQGFPESYKISLRTLHKQYPQWSFIAYQTGLSWNTVIKKESVLKLNLISKSKSIDWKSFETGAYDWSTDSFVVLDGTEWVTPSKAGLEYYMDPRNFLNDDSVYQFEQLAYVKGQQTIEGIEKLLKDTPLSNKKITFTDENNKKQTMTYAQIFLKAAEISGVNPYHLASRVKQEVVTSKTTLSGSASGKTAGYEGYYNFYNIGASSSTTAGGNVTAALKYAKNGSTAAKNAKYLIPWNNPYRAIVGGAKYIGSDYINCGQDTIYLQKFNVTNKNTYSHQYMANVEAPAKEAAKCKTAYGNVGDMPFVFSIPVYKNMPEKACAAPTGTKNPNNWLKTLSVEGYTLTPKFSVKDPEGTEYTLKVASTVKSVKITAKAVSSLAKVKGTGTKTLSSGTNTVTVSVTAEDGNVRKYVIHIKK